MFAVPAAVQSLSDELLKYYQQVTRAILGDDPHLMKVHPWRACSCPVTLNSVLLLILFFLWGCSVGPSVKLQDRCPPALLCLRHQWGTSCLWWIGVGQTSQRGGWTHFLICVGEICQSRLGAAQQAPPHGQKPCPEPLSLPGLLRAQPGVQRHVLHPGTASSIHQPAQWPLDPQGLRCPAAQSHILVSMSLVTLSLPQYEEPSTRCLFKWMALVHGPFQSSKCIYKLLSSFALSQCIMGRVWTPSAWKVFW